MIKKYLTSLLLWATLIIGELHTFFENSSIKPVNWIYARKVPMPLQWNVKFVSEEVQFIILPLAIWFYIKNRINDTTVLTFIIFGGMDIGMYFYNYKVYGFGTVYVLFLILWIVIYNTYGRRYQTTNRQGVITQT